MILLAHRGHWKHRNERNTAKAFSAAFERGYGIETDVRDLGGELVIAHDPPVSPELTLAQFLDLHAAYPGDLTLALNIKADGLAVPLKAMLAERGVKNYFVFDMSVPDSLSYFRAGMPVFTRRSEHETGSTLDSQADGLWLDWFGEGHTPAAEVNRYIDSGKRVAMVSPELHGRKPDAAWADWRAAGCATRRSGAFLLCTDLCEEAEDYFAKTN